MPKAGVITGLDTKVLKYCASDLQWGFDQIGWETTLLHEGTEWAEFDEHMLTPEDVERWYEDEKPDIVCQFDGLRTNIPPHIVPDSVPWVCWILDRLPWLYKDQEVIAGLGKGGRKDITLAMFPLMRDELIKLGYPEAMTHTMYVGANTDIYKPMEGVKPECDISFATRMNTNMPAKRQRRRAKAASIALMASDSVRLYGDGWDQYSEFAPFFLGPLAPGPELCKAYQSSFLHIHSNEDTNYHMRVFECIASGGRVAVYNPEDMPMPVESGAFKTTGQLKALLDEAKGGAPADGNEWVKTHHSWAVRAKAIEGML